ncbi:hypothetical protein U0070_003917 [Myodes glareolus]|uniref:Coiled-coil domain-containing protein 195 n=1 Tax=Myodes glareolus TaxID=447135 RepID=A0AAW0HXD8_MYOGA
MEASIHLMQVIQEMRAEINRLEEENHALRVKLTSVSQTASGSEKESGDEREEAEYQQAPGALPHSVPTDSPAAVQEQGNVMIVRRYSVSPAVHSCAVDDPWKARSRLPNIIGASRSSTRNQDNGEKTLAADAYSSSSSSQRASSDHSFVCR